MTLEDLIRRFRVKAQDKAAPYLADDEVVTDWLNDAVEQAAIRGRLLREDANDDICRIDLTSASQHTWPLHESVFEIINIRLCTVNDAPDEDTRLWLVSREWLDREVPQWRTNFTERAKYAIQDENTLRIVGTFPVGAWLQMEVYRLPINPLVGDSDSPEIHRAHHEHLLDWALHEFYAIPDTEFYDSKRSEQHEQAFTDYFGPLPDSDMRRTTRHDLFHGNEVILP